jgi:hypothetical protein
LVFCQKSLLCNYWTYGSDPSYSFCPHCVQVMGDLWEGEGKCSYQWHSAN